VTTDNPDTLHVLNARAGNYKVKVTYGADAEVPEGAKLAVEEIDDASREYEEYAAAAEDALGMEEGSALLALRTCICASTWLLSSLAPCS